MTLPGKEGAVDPGAFRTIWSSKIPFLKSQRQIALAKGGSLRPPCDLQKVPKTAVEELGNAV